MIDIPMVLEKMGYFTELYPLEFGAKDYSLEFVYQCQSVIIQKEVQYVFSCDFSRVISEACFLSSVPYVSWVYDCPQAELYSLQAFYDTNYIFVFDKMQCARIKDIGVKNVFHMPLAIYPDRIEAALAQEDKLYCDGDICFIGQLYRSNANEKILDLLSNDASLRWDEIVNKSLFRWDNSTSMYGTLSEEFVKLFASFPYSVNKNDTPFMSEQFRYEVAVLSRNIAHKERVTILNSLAEKYKLAFYTEDKELNELSDKVLIHPGLDYSSFEIYQIYNSSKININISLHCIESGLPQRIFDVMAAGGFMLTNYQAEIEDLFIIGEEIEVYHNIEELFDKVDYYYSHDAERRRIAKRGQKKVLMFHSYEKRFCEVFNIMDTIEAGKESNDIFLRINSLAEGDKDNKTILLNEINSMDNKISILRYYILRYPDDDVGKIYLANAYMDNKLWGSAWELLNSISFPNGMVKNIIQMLEKIVYPRKD